MSSDEIYTEEEGQGVFEFVSHGLVVRHASKLERGAGLKKLKVPMQTLL